MQTVFMILGIVIILYVVFSFYVGYTAFKASCRCGEIHDKSDMTFYHGTKWEPIAPFMAECMRSINALDHEIITIKSFDGFKLKGKYFPAEKDSENAVILVHGYETIAENNFSPAFFFYRKLGFNILLIDQRCHNMSEGDYICFGHKEKKDILAFADLLEGKYGIRSTVLHGVSMGAATVMLAVCEKNIPKSIKCFVEDCGYSSTTKVFRDKIKGKIRAFLWMPAVCTSLIYYAATGVSFFERCAVKLKKNEIPALFIHGKADTVISVSECVKCYNGNRGQKEMLLFDNTEHAFCWISHEKECEEAVLRLIKKAGITA